MDIKNSCCVIILEINGSKIVLDNPDAAVKEFDINELKKQVDWSILQKGDNLRLYLSPDDQSRVEYMEPWCEPNKFEGEVIDLLNHLCVTQCNNDDQILVENSDMNFKSGDRIHGMYVIGNYYVGDKLYERRAISAKLLLEKRTSGNRMQFKNAIHCGDSHYDLPNGLFSEITKQNPAAVLKKLDELVPKTPMAHFNYAQRLHALLYLEEVEMRLTFQKYKCSSCGIKYDYDKKRLYIEFEEIEELRPPISMGRFIINSSNYLKRFHKLK